METKHLKLVYDINCNVTDQGTARAINVYDDRGNFVDAVSLPLWTDDRFRLYYEDYWLQDLYDSLKDNILFRGIKRELKTLLPYYIGEVRRSIEEAEKEIEKINERTNN